MMRMKRAGLPIAFPGSLFLVLLDDVSSHTHKWRKRF